MIGFKHIIEQERLGLWVAVTFILALLALVVALVGIQRNAELAYLSQAEVLILKKHIEEAKTGIKTPAPSEAPESK